MKKTNIAVLLLFVAIIDLSLMAQKVQALPYDKPVENKKMTDRESICAIIRDLEQAIRSGDGRRLRRYCRTKSSPTALRPFEYACTSKGVDSKNRIDENSKVVLFGMKIDSVKILSNKALVQCSILENDKKTQNINIDFSKINKRWYLDQHDEFLRVSSDFIQRNGTLQDYLRLAKKSNALSKDVATIDGSVNMNIVESQRMFVPFRWSSAPLIWEVTETDAMNYCDGNPVFGSIDDFECISNYNTGTGRVDDNVLFAVDWSRSRIIYASENGLWIKSYGDWPGDYELPHASGLRAIQKSDGTILVFIAVPLKGEVAVLQYNTVTETLVYSRSIKGPLISPVDVDINIDDVGMIWVADKGLKALLCLDINGFEYKRFNEYTYNGQSYPLSNVKKIAINESGAFSFIDGNTNSLVTYYEYFVWTGGDWELVYDFNMCRFDPPSRLINLIRHYGDDIVAVDQNNSILHAFSFWGEYLGSYKQYDVSAAVNPSVFSGRAGIPLFYHPQSSSSSMYNNCIFPGYLDFGITNAWLVNSGGIRFLPGVDIHDLEVTLTYSDVIFEFTQVGYCHGNSKICDLDGHVLYDFGEYDLYSGRLIGSAPQSALGYGTFIFSISATPFSNDNYGDYQQQPIELSCEFSINDATSTVAVSAGWNIVSVPLLQLNYDASIVFPGKLGDIYSYNTTTDGYETAPTLASGPGYWVRYPVSTNVTINGTIPRALNVTASKDGWLLLGSHTTNFDISSLNLSDDAVLNGPAYRFNTTSNGYESTSTVNPGEGVWVNVSKACTITIPAP